MQLTQCMLLHRLNKANRAGSEHTHSSADSVQPTAQHELLFRVKQYRSCTVRDVSPYSSFRTYPRRRSQFSGKRNISEARFIPPVGFGQPSVYSTINMFSPSSTHRRGSLVPNAIWPISNHAARIVRMQSLLEPLARHIRSLIHHRSNADTYVQWYPDFPGCDAAGDRQFCGGNWYGISGVVLEVFKIYQAQPT